MFVSNLNFYFHYCILLSNGILHTIFIIALQAVFIQSIIHKIIVRIANLKRKIDSAKEQSMKFSLKVIGKTSKSQLKMSIHLYKRYPIVARRAWPSASREQRYLAYKAYICSNI